MNIKTNNHWRDYVFRADVPEDVLNGDLDWTDDGDTDGYFQYRESWYHIKMFMRFNFCGGHTPERLEGWQGYMNDSYFSGVVISQNEEGQYKVGRFYS